MKSARFFSSLVALALVLPGVAFAAGTTAWVSSNHIQVVDLDAGKVVGKIPLKEFIHDMEFHPAGHSVYVSSSKGLRVADASALEFTQRVSEQTTGALALSADGSTLAALHLPGRESVLAARRAKQPLPNGTLVVYDTAGMTQTSSFPISANAFDVVMSPNGERLYVLVPHEGSVYVHGVDGTVIEQIRLADKDTMLSKMALSPNGNTLVVPATNAEASWLNEVDLAQTRSAEDRILRGELGHARRISATAFDDDGSGIYVTAIRSMVKFDNTTRLPVSWKGYPTNFVDVEPLPGSDRSVMVAPTFVKNNGGVAIVDRNGTVVTAVELTDMSPFVVVLAP
jgi:WD40 repeat protein